MVDDNLTIRNDSIYLNKEPTELLAKITSEGEIIIYWENMEKAANDRNSLCHSWAKIVIFALEEGRKARAGIAPGS